jgi:uncharacterized protein (TIGR03382 family)
LLPTSIGDVCGTVTFDAAGTLPLVGVTASWLVVLIVA